MEMEKRQHNTASCKTGKRSSLCCYALCVLRTISEANRKSVMFYRAAGYSAGNCILLVTGFRLFEYEVCVE